MTRKRPSRRAAIREFTQERRKAAKADAIETARRLRREEAERRERIDSALAFFEVLGRGEGYSLH